MRNAIKPLKKSCLSHWRTKLPFTVWKRTWLVMIVGRKSCIRNFPNLCNISESQGWIVSWTHHNVFDWIKILFMNVALWARIFLNSPIKQCKVARIRQIDAPCSCSSTMKRSLPKLSHFRRTSFLSRWEIKNVVNLCLFVFSCSTDFYEISTCVCRRSFVIYPFCLTLI